MNGLWFFLEILDPRGNWEAWIAAFIGGIIWLGLVFYYVFAYDGPRWFEKAVTLCP